MCSALYSYNLSSKHPFCLCSGKSTVGKLVASALKYPYLDSDTLIEQLAGCTISHIFNTEGEEEFRDMESQVLQVGSQLEQGCSFFSLGSPIALLRVLKCEKIL